MKQKIGEELEVEYSIRENYEISLNGKVLVVLNSEEIDNLYYFKDATENGV